MLIYNEIYYPQNHIFFCILEIKYPRKFRAEKYVQFSGNWFFEAFMGTIFLQSRLAIINFSPSYFPIRNWPRPGTYSKLCQTSNMERFCRNSERLSAVNYFGNPLHLRCLPDFLKRLCYSYLRHFLFWWLEIQIFISIRSYSCSNTRANYLNYAECICAISRYYTLLQGINFYDFRQNLRK